MATAQTKIRPNPFLFPDLCKACGRGNEACPEGSLRTGTGVDPVSGFPPVVIDLDSCGVRRHRPAALPEPCGLMPIPSGMAPDLVEPEALFGPRPTAAPEATAIPDTRAPLPQLELLVPTGIHASAHGALLVGCRNFFGDPITPSSNGAERMAALPPALGGVFIPTA